MPDKCQSKASITKSYPQHFHAWNSTTISSLIYDISCYPQIGSFCFIKGNHPQVFHELCRSFPLFPSPDHNSSDSYLIVHPKIPNQATKLSTAAKLVGVVTLLILPASLIIKVNTGQHIFLLWHLLKKASCAKLCVFLPQKV